MSADPQDPVVHVQLVDLDPRALEAGVRWLDESYLPDTVASGAWGRGRRFSCHDEPHLQLVVLDACAQGDPPEPVPAFASAFGRRWVRSHFGMAFRQVSVTPARDQELDDPRFVNAIITFVERDGAATFDRWYDDVHVPDILGCPGWESARRFRAHDGSPLYLALYELADLETPFSSTEYEQAVGWGEVEHVLRGYHGFRTYRLEHSFA